MKWAILLLLLIPLATAEEFVLEEGESGYAGEADEKAVIHVKEIEPREYKGCPIPMCMMPEEGCKYVFSDEKNENGCPMYPCGIMKCPDNNLVCPEIYSPVCGLDGKTYDNECLAKAAGIDIKYEGKCQVPCPKIYKPVCGSDRNTYSNECFALNQGVEIKHTGQCVDIICPKLYKPICGSDGKTYENECFAFVKSVSTICQGPCPCEEQACPKVYKPVCGSDGNVYSNSCYAEKEGTTVECEGECPCPFVCDGCAVDETCIPVTIRKDGQYCDLNKELHDQKTAGVVCENDFECKSNVCVNSECVGENFMKRIFSFFTKWFK